MAPSSLMRLQSADFIWVVTGISDCLDNPSLVMVFRPAMLLMHPVSAVTCRVALCCWWALSVFGRCGASPGFGSRATASSHIVGCGCALILVQILLMLSWMWWSMVVFVFCQSYVFMMAPPMMISSCGWSSMAANFCAGDLQQLLKWCLVEHLLQDFPMAGQPSLRRISVDPFPL